MKRKNEQKIGDVIGEFVDQNQIKEGYRRIAIHKFWRSQMGPMINKYTHKIAFHNGVLTVYISSGSLRQELNFSKVKIKRLLDKQFGKGYVREIEIK